MPHELSSRGVHQIDFGPLPWQKMAEAVQSELERDNRSHETLVNSFGSDNLQVCSKSHDNEVILHGAWIEQQIKAIGDLSYVNMTIQAKWTPFKMCKLIQQGPTGIGKHFRMGDSTVPGRNIEIGVPFAPYYKNYKQQQEQYIDMLRTKLTEINTTSKDDTFLYGGGLHHLFHLNFNAPATATLVMWTMCQIGLVFPGKMFLRGPNPIQQHLHWSTDQTSLNVRRINWELHILLSKSGYRLANICQTLSDNHNVTSLVSLADEEGDILPDDAAKPILLQKYNYSWERDVPANTSSFWGWMRNLTVEQRNQRYWNRSVGFIDLEEFLLPRPEVYRPNDKIHDGSEFFFHKHSPMLAIVEGMHD